MRQTRTISIRRPGLWRWAGLPGLALVAALALLLIAPIPASAHGGGPAFTQTVAAGPYILDVSLSSYPPFTEQNVTLTVTPHTRGLRLSGSAVVTPGLGTDAVPLSATFSAPDANGALNAQIHMPVKGAWNIVVNLNGPRGAGTATIGIVVGAPGAIPIWMGWLIGLTPIYALIVLIWSQTRYRRALAAQLAASAAGAAG